MAQLLLMIFFIILPLLFLLLNFMLSKKSYNYREKISPFECGFDPLSHSHLPFSSQFFMISLIFLIFDIEIALLIPLIFTFNFYLFTSIFLPLVFILILMFGLYMEYSEFSLDWKF